MRLADAARRALAAAVLIAVGAMAAEPRYGQVETFEPGKKYKCVPTPDHKGWDCRELGKGEADDGSGAHAAASSTVAPAAPVPAPAVAAPAAPPAVKPPQPAAAAPAPEPPPTRAAALPAYLRAPRSGAARSPVEASQSVAPPAEPPRRAAQPPPAPTPALEPPKAPVAAKAPAMPASTVKEHAAAQTPRPAAGVTPEPRAAARTPAAAPPAMPDAATGAGNHEFLALPGASYVLELAHSANASDLRAARDAVHPSHGVLYEVRLRRDGGDWWLLLWGSFDSIEAARAARAELPADAAINAGWPRRIAPLQAEVQRAGG